MIRYSPDHCQSHLRPKSSGCRSATGCASSLAESSAASQPESSQSESFFGSTSELLSLLQRMVVFIIPLTALVLSEPLLVWCTSLFIGQFGTISELAALGPANIVIGGKSVLPCA